MPIFKHAGRLIYFAHVPKCAGTSVEDYLVRRLGPAAFLDRMHRQGRHSWNKTSPQHIGTADLRRLFPDRFFDESFAIVRHPEARLRSAFAFARRLPRGVAAKADLAQWFAANRDPASLARPRFDNHFLPQSEIVPPGARVFRLEDGLDALVAYIDGLVGASAPEITIAHSNRGKRPYLAPIDDETRAMIEETYAADYDRFGYTRGAPPAPAKPPAEAEEASAP
ncbi:MAG: sulfotransferase family 2 domain-containing protein [Pseudomonadota bacterium]